ncbi:hypothetical protein DIPPA_17419 [Diplonema papillatum]|nr:hypothetical protein DIPPA_17419 [Diplonema papillatum]
MFKTSLLVALSLLVACCSGAAWNPYQPAHPTDPDAHCYGEYGDWLTVKPWGYAACIPDWASPAPYNGSDASKALAIASGQPDYLTYAKPVDYEYCVSFCYTRDMWGMGDPRWVFGIYDPAEEKCMCYFVGSQGVADTLYSSFGVAKTDADPRNEECVAYALMIPLSCLWTPSGACIHAPGAPDGCLWTEEKCCVNAMGYEPSTMWKLIMDYPLLLLCGLMLLPLSILFKRKKATYSRGSIGGNYGSMDSLNASRTHSDADEAAEHKEKQAACLASLRAAARESTFTNEEDDICAICLESMVPAGPDGSVSVVSLPCAHVYHLSCLELFLTHQLTAETMRCPTCRGCIVEPDGDPSSLTEQGSRSSRLATMLGTMVNGLSRHPSSAAPAMIPPPPATPTPPSPPLTPHPPSDRPTTHLLLNEQVFLDASV